MPRTAVPLQKIPRNGAISDIAWTAADAVNGHEFRNNGKVLLLAKNTDVSSKTVTVVSVPDEAGRTGDLVINVPATNGIAIAGPFRPVWWNRREAGLTGLVHVDVANATGLSLACVAYEE